MNLDIKADSSKEDVFNQVENYLNELGLKIAETDKQRPWGGFFVIDNESIQGFIDKYFPEIPKDEVYKHGSELSPKILLVEPHKELSWQYHYRRAELWKAVVGPVGVLISDTDEKPDNHEVLNTGETVEHDSLVRHRLIGLDTWGVVAEIWQHTEDGNPSDESDIVRVEDAYGRN